jgi:DNA polymerase-1
MSALSFDTETKGLSWWDPDEQAFLATWADESTQQHAVLSDPDDTAKFTGSLMKAPTLIGHNLKFDIHQTYETLGLDVLELGAELHDTDLLARVVHPELRSTGKGYGLKELGKVFVDGSAAEAEDAIKDMGKAIGLRTMRQAGAYYDVWRAYPEVMEEYARQDARLTYDLYDLMAPSLSDPAIKRIYDLEMAVLPVLTRAERRGIRTDQAAVARLKAEYEPALLEVREYLTVELGEQALGGEGSGDALTEALLSLGVPLHKKTDSGKLATNKFALAEFAAEYPQIAKLEEYRTLSRFLSTYIGAVEGRDVVHADFMQFEAWTGRMSCRRPNMQNWPQRAGKEVRAVFVPREGHSFVICDYDTIEVRLLAYYLGDEHFRQMIAEGRDMHSWMAAQIWGGEPNDWRKDGPRAEGEQSRKTARHTLFAVMYGAGAKRVAAMNGMEYDDAKALISKIKSSLPNYYKLNKRIRNKVESEGHINTLFGRKNVVKKDKAYVGLNALIQGSAADVMKAGLVLVDEAVRPLGGIPLLVVHDEVVVEVPSEFAAECLALAEQALVSAYALSPPLGVSGSVVTTSYADA